MLYVEVCNAKAKRISLAIRTLPKLSFICFAAFVVLDACSGQHRPTTSEPPVTFASPLGTVAPRAQKPTTYDGHVLAGNQDALAANYGAATEEFKAAEPLAPTACAKRLMEIFILSAQKTEALVKAGKLTEDSSVDYFEELRTQLWMKEPCDHPRP